jgi:hypothetical protein
MLKTVGSPDFKITINAHSFFCYKDSSLAFVKADSAGVVAKELDTFFEIMPDYDVVCMQDLDLAHCNVVSAVNALSSL